ncbi:MAG: hypothetical protein WCF67_04100, partial [Chitinophagaceae bacterium]
MKLFMLWLSLCAMTLLPLCANSQDVVDKVIDFPGKIVRQLQKKAADADEKILRQTERSMRTLQRQEEKMRKKLFAKDSAGAKDIFDPSQVKYTEYLTNLQNGTFRLDQRKVGEYLPYFDSLKSSLKFLQTSEQLMQNIPMQNDVNNALSSFNQVQDKLKYVSEIRRYLKQRKAFLHEQLGKHGFSAQLKKIDKEVYYYAEHIKQYKALLNDPNRQQQEALRLLNKIPAFKEFVKKNSFLSALLGSNDFSSFAGMNAADIPDMPGLQSRAQVQSVVNTNVLSAGSGGQDILTQRLSTVKDELKKLKNSASSWDENSEMPDFKPNEMKAKSFLQKLELGTNLQFGKSNSFVPSTADIGAQVAYKFHQNGNFGLGMSYKLGWGDIRHISFSHQGVGFRSFLDYRMKKNFFVNGGFEYNYNAAFKNIAQLKDFDAWQKSALFGVSRKYRINKKIKGNMVLLYDFLHKQHIPNTQPLV